MGLHEYQRRVDEWINQFEEGYWHPLSMLTSLVEEVGELSKEINDLYGEKTKKEEQRKEELEKEMGDILFSLICMANDMDIDLDKAFKKTLKNMMPGTKIDGP